MLIFIIIDVTRFGKFGDIIYTQSIITIITYHGTSI